jgi:hypothetical protein
MKKARNVQKARSGDQLKRNVFRWKTLVKERIKMNNLINRIDEQLSLNEGSAKKQAMAAEKKYHNAITKAEKKIISDIYSALKSAETTDDFDYLDTMATDMIDNSVYHDDFDKLITDIQDKWHKFGV